MMHGPERGSGEPRNRIDVVLRFSLADFETGEDEEGEDLGEARCNLVLEPLGENLFRVPEPTSLTPFGPIGPSFRLGQIIEAEYIAEGVLRYLGTRLTPQVWSIRFSRVPQEAVEKGPVSDLLGRLRDLGHGWEWSGGNLTIQRPENQEDQDRDVDLLLRKLERMLSRMESSDFGASEA